MDQSATNIQTILALDLVVIAFAMIPGLKNAFDALIAKIHQSTPERTIDDIYQEIKIKFYERICEVMREKFELLEDLKQLDPKYSVTPKDIIFHSRYWFNTFKSLYYEISDKLDESYYEFEFAFANLSKFKTIFNEYMHRFAKIYKCKPGSDSYRNEYNFVRESIIKIAKRRLDYLKEYFEIIRDYDRYYDGISPDFVMHVEEVWINSFSEYLESEDQKNDYLDKSHVSFKVELDEKEEKRVSYERKKKNAHKHNKRRNTNKFL